jgi:hypothetical protein
MKWDVALDEVVVVAAAAPDEGRDKAPDGWAVQPPGQAASVSARRVDIVNRTFPDYPVPKSNAQNVARG